MPQALPVASATCDAAVSGLVLNFMADPAAMVREMIARDEAREAASRRTSGTTPGACR